MARFYKAKKSHVITTQIVSDSTVEHVVEKIRILFQEHKCVLDSCRALESEGMNVTYLPVAKNGIINLEVGPSNFLLVNDCQSEAGAGGGHDTRDFPCVRDDCQ